jgi:acetylornithine/N-succinyldiaminopimelate aminotransferase
VQCGYGRTGKFFSHDYAGVNADIYTMAKGMGNGFPVAGIIIAPHILPKHGMLGTTFGGNHLACVAALAVLEVIEKDALLENALTIGNYIMDELKTIPQLKNVRGEHKDLKKRLLSEHFIFTGEAKPNVIRLLPALNIQKREANMLINAIKEEVGFND